jgi:hypothetical protein
MWGDRRPNKRVSVDGINFHSIAEANQYQELKLREKTGEIYELEHQIRIPIVINGIHICYYIADFRYKHLNEALPIIHEHKGYWEEKALLKWQIVQALYQDRYKFVVSGEAKKATYASKRGSVRPSSFARR